ncbi:hypothetical protein [Deinococcus multiflagellatus]|uniref:Transposase n=1 Tax=Deinococcus multiflagellatus TaxID=1656887 RepID=A0ABW1ZPT5_9DEIO|nr:hypothetical protein [Deinococcus multiflagellatus]MBZ9714960.1 hypothetical protein [Deinococcus multiflagellatus]
MKGHNANVQLLGQMWVPGFDIEKDIPKATSLFLLKRYKQLAFKKNGDICFHTLTGHRYLLSDVRQHGVLMNRSADSHSSAVEASE